MKHTVTITIESEDNLKFQTQMTSEVLEDLKEIHSVSGLQEIYKRGLESIVDRRVEQKLRSIKNSSEAEMTWSYDVSENKAKHADFPWTQKDWNQTLITAINQVNTGLHQRNPDAEHEYKNMILIVSMEAAAILDDLEYFLVSEVSTHQSSHELIGSLGGRYTVIRDVHLPMEDIIICTEKTYNSGKADKNNKVGMVKIKNLPCY